MKAESINQSEDRSMAPDRHEKIRTGLGADAIAEDLIDNLYFLQAKLLLHATRNDWYMALAYTVCDRMLDRYIRDVVGAENFFLFGLTAQEVQKRKADGYSPARYL